MTCRRAADAVDPHVNLNGPGKQKPLERVIQLMIDRVKSSRMRVRQAVGLLAVGWAALVARPAHAASDHDFYLSMLGESGVELFSDERLFALFAAFNALGYDNGPAVRKDPIARASFTPLRVATRAQVQMSVALQKRFQDFFDAHPLPRDAYIAYSMSLGSAPAFAPPSTGAPKGKSLAGFEKLLAAHEAEAHVSQVYQSMTSQIRDLLKGTLAQLDPTCRSADKFLAPATAPASLALNLLDDPTVHAIVELGAVTTAVAGVAPGKNADLASAVEAYAAARAMPTLQAHPAPGGVSEVLGRVRQRSLPAGSLSANAFVADSYGAAVAAQVLPQHRQAILAEAEGRGLWLASDFDHLLAEDQGKTPADEILSQRLGNMDFKKVAPSGL